MFSKLAFNNVKKSIKDYTIYFLTLTFGVCLFYTFNSIESQQSMLYITESQHNILKTLTQVMGAVSIFISVILGFLIIYANKFLIKRRKKELGIYMTLGMDKDKISRILMLETVIIGLFALGVGLLIGIFASQGLSVVTAKMMKTSIKRFYFIFSGEACLKAILYFSIIFLIVIIFNTIAVSKYKLIDLLYGSKKNESLKVKKLWISVVLFLVSVVSLGTAYYLIIDNGMRDLNTGFYSSIILGIIGTLLFFLSLSGFLLKVVKSNKNFYFKNLNMFVLRQINSKINTTYISMTLICLILLLTIGMLSTGLGVSKALTGGMDQSTPYDATFSIYTSEKNKELKSIKEGLIKDKFPFDKIIKESSEVNYYQLPEIKYKELVFGGTKAFEKKVSIKRLKDSPINIVKLSDYNKARKMQGLQSIQLDNNEFILNCTFKESKPIYEYFIKHPKGVTIGNKEYKLGSNKIYKMSLDTTTMPMDVGTMVIADNALDGKLPEMMILNVNYKESNQKYEDKFMKAIKTNYPEGATKPYWYLHSKIQIFEEGAGIKTIAAYFILYIGIIFLITCAAVLALQQLSESSDNIERYKLLRKIGVEEKMMNHSLFTQIFIYFMMPLVLAIIHSIVGIGVANNVISVIGELDAIGNIIFTAVTLLVIYGGYFIATYIGSKNIIKERN